MRLRLRGKHFFGRKERLGAQKSIKRLPKLQRCKIGFAFE